MPDSRATERLSDADWLAARCASRSASSIARELGVAADTVLRAMRQHGIPVRSSGARRPTRPELDDRDWLADRYASGTSMMIADDLGVHHSTVLRAL